MHPKRIQCNLCGDRMVIPDSAFHVSSSYRLYFCKGCTALMLELIRKQKLVWVKEEYGL